MSSIDTWFAWAVISTILFGIHSFLYQKLIKDGGDTLVAQMVGPIVLVMISTAILLISGEMIAERPWVVALIAVLQGVLFFFTTLCRVEALTIGIPAQLLFPIIKSSTPLVVILSCFIFDEWFILAQPRRLVGVVLALGTTFIVMRPVDGDRSTRFDRGMMLAVAAMLSSAGASLAAKLAFVTEGQVNIIGFMLFSNLASMVLAAGRAGGHKATAFAFRRGLSWGAIIGVINFLGFAAYLLAIKDGELSLVASINSLYILIPMILSALIYHEHLGPRRLTAVLLSLLAIVLIV